VKIILKVFKNHPKGPFVNKCGRIERIGRKFKVLDSLIVFEEK
jgi:hypothetical protein